MGNEIFEALKENWMWIIMLSMLFSNEWRVRGLILICMDRAVACSGMPVIPWFCYILLFISFIALGRVESRNYYAKKYNDSLSKMTVKHIDEIRMYKKKIYQLERELRKKENIEEG